MESSAEVSFMKDIGTIARLCEICRQTIRDWDNLIDYSILPHHNSLLELRQSAKKGCDLCALVTGDAVCRGCFDEIDWESKEEGRKADENDLSEMESLDTQSPSKIQSDDSDHQVCGRESIVSRNELPPGCFEWILGRLRTSESDSVIVFSPVPHPGA